MSVRRFPPKRDHRHREALVFLKNVQAANLCCECEVNDEAEQRLIKICEMLSLGEELTAIGWKVHVTPFESLPMLHVRATKKTRGLRQ